MTDFFSGISATRLFPRQSAFSQESSQRVSDGPVPVAAGHSPEQDFWHSSRSRNRNFFITAFSFAAVFLGAYYFYFFIESAIGRRAFSVRGGRSFSGDRFRRADRRRRNIFLFPPKLQPPFAGKITVFAPPGSDIRYGDLVGYLGRDRPPTQRGRSAGGISETDRRGFARQRFLAHGEIAGYQKGDQRKIWRILAAG